jgi:putative polyhydroxyalkanoate system protein
MATIDLSKSHSLPLEDARSRAEEIAKSMESKIGIQWKWDGNTIRFEAPSGAAKGTKGELTVSASDVKIAIDLPFMLRVMKGTIEDKIKEKLDQMK